MPISTDFQVVLCIRLATVHGSSLIFLRALHAVLRAGTMTPPGLVCRLGEELSWKGKGMRILHGTVVKLFLDGLNMSQLLCHYVFHCEFWCLHQRPR